MFAGRVFETAVLAFDFLGFGVLFLTITHSYKKMTNHQ